MFSLLDMLSRQDRWEKFYEYKCSLACPKQFTRELRSFIDNREYLPVCEKISAGAPFSLPRRAEISKLDTGKKRVIYIYPKPENTVLKLLTHLLLRKYDGLFSDGLYSFRPGRTAQMAFRRLARRPGIGGMWCYKADISNYFNSVDVDKLLPMLKNVTGEDAALFSFLSSLLQEERVLDSGKIITEKKGIMAGTPLSAFYANLFLRELDASFEERNIIYLRYSDDIILFAETKEQAERYAAEVKESLSALGLSVNPDKEILTAPGEKWTFLGLSHENGEIDIAEASVMKLKAKMRRKTRALKRWYERREIPSEKAAGAFIRIFERKLYEAGSDNELSWARWYFPVITTDRSLKEIDSYAQDCLRYLISGKRTKGRYNVRYEQLQALGYHSCVNRYYKSVLARQGRAPAPSSAEPYNVREER